HVRMNMGGVRMKLIFKGGNLNLKRLFVFFAFVSDIDTSKELETASHLASTFAQGKRSMTFYRLPAAFLVIKIISN
ncbi:hypothetical protein, partial [Collinsella aerofaciens]|uniref:hypothetical protein n=1 Tax=Collinsella aerofaciens TaxID=74426 RepID=UPI001E643A4F